MSRAESEFLDYIDLDWAQLPTGHILHACETFEGDDGLVPVGGPGVTVCGVRGRLGIPGLFSRLGAPRCRKCSKKLGWPKGTGSPKNDTAIRYLAEYRQSRWDGWQPTPEMAAEYAVRGEAMERFTAELKAARVSAGSG